MSNIKLFQSKQIRSVWNEEEQQWYFSVIDVVGALTDSIDPSAYWRKLKQRLISEGNETVTNCHRLKIQKICCALFNPFHLQKQNHLNNG